MQTLKVITKSGNYFTTGFNGSLQEAREYYLGADGKGRTFVSHEEDLTGVETYDTYEKVQPMWACKMVARLNGAIGITHPCELFLFADDAEGARLGCYDHFEHISNFTALEVK